MPKAIKLFVKYVEAVNYRIGRIAMYGIFVMAGILLWSSISKTFAAPSCAASTRAQTARLQTRLVRLVRLTETTRD